MEQKLDQQIEECANKGIKVEKIVVIGDASEEILKAVMEREWIF